VSGNAFHVLDEVHAGLATAGWERLHLSHAMIARMNAVLTRRDVNSGSLLLAFKVCKDFCVFPFWSSRVSVEHSFDLSVMVQLHVHPSCVLFIDDADARAAACADARAGACAGADASAGAGAGAGSGAGAGAGAD
jgi:hypothetical protein